MAMSAWTRLTRMSGLVELVCEHGVGHPSRRLTHRWRDVDGIHGCDGCCADREAFAQAEDKTEQERWLAMGWHKGPE